MRECVSTWVDGITLNLTDPHTHTLWLRPQAALGGETVWYVKHRAGVLGRGQEEIASGRLTGICPHQTGVGKMAGGGRVDQGNVQAITSSVQQSEIMRASAEFFWNMYRMDS